MYIVYQLYKWYEVYDFVHINSKHESGWVAFRRTLS
jgi:hypothetical protein